MVSQNAHSGSGVSLGLHDYLFWQHPYRKAHIYFHREVVRALSHEALHHLGQGTEIGGILWGKPGPGDSTIILDATLTPSSGSRFNTSGVDLRSLVQALEGQAPQASLSPAGYFRSHLREGLSLSAQDRQLIEQHLPELESVFLVIKPFEAGACTAGFFFWREGRLQNESDLEVPFVDDREPARPDSIHAADHHKHHEVSIVDILRESAMRQTPPQRAAAKPSANSAPGARAAARQPENQSSWQPLVITALMTMLILVGATAVYFDWPATRGLLQGVGVVEKPPETGIGLQVLRAPDGQLSLSWNQNAPEILNAHSGTLFITDGRSSPKLPLDNAQLRSGKLMYFPKSGQVQFRLELNLNDQHTLSESVLVLSPRGSARRGRRSGSGRLKQVARASVLARGGPDGTGNTQAFNPTASNHQTVGLPLPPAHPSQLPGIPPPPPQAVLNGTYVPPRAIQEMMPETTPLGRFAQISVQVTIDPKGSVTTARPSGNTGESVDNTLSAIAVAAARQWRFQPATLNGKPVAAEYTIVFAFHPQLP